MKITLDIPDNGWFKMNSNLELKEDVLYLVDANTESVPELCVYTDYRFLRILTTKHMRDWGGDGDTSMSYFELGEVDYIKPIKMENKYSALVILEMVKEWMQDE